MNKKQEKEFLKRYDKFKKIIYQLHFGMKKDKLLSMSIFIKLSY